MLRGAAGHARASLASRADITAHNDAGGAWLVVDGMVLDVKRWLPEHPAGIRSYPRILRADAAHTSSSTTAAESRSCTSSIFTSGRCSRTIVASVPLSRGHRRATISRSNFASTRRIFASTPPSCPRRTSARTSARGASDARKRTRRESRQSVETWSFSVSRRISKRLAVGTPAVCVQRAPRVRILRGFE